MSYSVIINNDQCLQIEIRRKPTYNIVIFTGFFVITSLGIAYSVIAQIIQFPYKLTEEAVILLCVLIIAALYMLKLCLWHLRGKEKVIINEKELIIYKTGTLLSVPRRYELNFVVNFLAASHSPYPWWMKISGIAGGQVEFHYLGTPRYFGQTVSLEQAQEIADLINARISYV